MKAENILTAPFVAEFIETASNMYRLGWNERNGGNISYLVTDAELAPYLDVCRGKREIPLHFNASKLKGCYFLVTGSGKYFKNMAQNPAANLGIIVINADGRTATILWGLENGAVPTSELPSHLMSHIVRRETEPDNRVVMHCHATNLLAMSFTHELDERLFTRTVWQMCTECLVIFPDGIGIVPWMVPGTLAIGEATAAKMRDSRLVLWPHHGVYGSGRSFDEAFGLIETAEKAAAVYTCVKAQGQILQTITDDNLRDLAKAFNVKVRAGYLEE